MLSRAAFSRAIAITSGDLSMPITWLARAASFGVNGPSPHPASSARSHGTGMRSRSQGWNCKLWLHGARALRVSSDAELIDVVQQVLRIVIDAVRAGAFELFATIASGQHADTQC